MTRPFQLKYATMEIKRTDNQTVRALILIASPAPKNPNLFLCHVALETGEMFERIVTKLEFEIANQPQNMTILREVPSLKGSDIGLGAGKILKP